jgi:predicted ester cyclase
MLRKVSRLYLYGLLFLLLLATAACQPVQALPATQTTATASAEAKLEQANKAVVQRFYDEVVNQKHMNVLDEVFDPHMVAHELGLTPALSNTVLFTGLPDLHLTVDLWVIEGDLVTAMVTVSGTHQAEMMGVAPTGNQVTFSQIDIWRVKDGKITDVWHNFANADILQQIGYQLVPPAK